VRLSYLKLSGFKSFVDPTTLHFPGDLVGIVGPNGCGKSNVIDAVRWVLGESRASELRGESMQDVIFSGSVTRKPAGRASVELVFDNAAGRLTGPWSQYSEVSVKRVLTRDGQSTYWINNQSVRRKDVHDLFMGTGLGPRAYAIIGQGMITRVIESRPEELRIFLEEAAGVSRYRERRKETEGRLADTRENLSRVEDIRLELGTRITRLGQQAEEARRHTELTSRRDERQRWLWWLRRDEYVQALAQSESQRRETELAVESLLAAQRALERDLEISRSRYHEASDAVHDAQQALYEANSAISQVEAEQRRLRDARDRAVRDQEQAQAVIDTEERLVEEGALRRAADDEAAAMASVRLAEQRQEVDRIAASLSPFEKALASRNESLAAAQADVAAAQAELRAIGQQQGELTARVQRIEQRIEDTDRERMSIERVDPSVGELLRTQREEALAASVAAAAQLADAEAAIEQARAERERLQQETQKAREDLARQQAELEALQSLQASLDAKDRLKPWLERQGMSGQSRLWQRLRVREGWQTAVESVLADRIAALEVGSISRAAGFASDAPPARLALFSTGTASASTAEPGTLAAQILGDDAAAHTVRGWLNGVHCADSLAEAVAAADASTSAGDAASRRWVTREGHLAASGLLRFHAQDDAGAAALSRRNRMEQLEASVRGHQIMAEETGLALQRADLQLAERQQMLAAQRDKVRSAQARAHELELAELRLLEKIERLASRDASVGATLDTLRQERTELEAARDRAVQSFEEADLRLAGQQEEFEHQRELQERQAKEVAEVREQVQAAERAVQEAVMAQRLAEQQRQTHEARMRESAQRLQHARQRLQTARDELAAISASIDASDLQPLLERRVACESQVAALREQADTLGQAIRALEEQRLTADRSLEPLRATLSQCEAQASGARVGMAQIDEQLQDRNLQADAIGAEFQQAFSDGRPPRPQTLHAEVQRLGREIEAMGAVNLAALAELEQSTERKQFLDAQADDLGLAVSTLEDAIRKIDRETRSLLQETFDTVNRNFGELFPRLFGGGEAKLVMTGEEILDCGVQVMAQPPGKRNSTIHLLSGGEKALTATALVFALFQLNPAPFCLLDEVDAPLDEPNTERFCNLVRHMSSSTQFIFITHNKIAMESAQHLMGVTMQERGVSRIVAVDLDAANSVISEAA